ncbi:hypothetical protein EOT10_17070 [Streptomyces antnestii]|uniref:Uncharacterized protein n=1 Tax=Streptomyces antnestii TaxID=2494256 RepID=A0A3S2YZT5_9ACTN|nr:DUF6397 family protein [Streptomyces sp. San01]RVU23774.1 hypothetical protein EOT10_17070 [Streptomyces sp. San01]
MGGDTITTPATRAHAAPLAQGRAARELGLKRGEFELAVRLGRVRTVPADDGGRRRVAREEIERVRDSAGFPDRLREHVRAVGTTEGAGLMDITTARFTRLARAGILTPVKFYLNRYRAVVWLYLAEELREFAAAEVNAPLLTGRAPDRMRARLDAGVDLRARNWRSRHAGFLLGQCTDAWERAAAVASLLDPVQIAELVRCPYERGYLHKLRPEPSGHGAPDSPAARIAERITTADDPHEISWLRASLLLSMAEARRLRPAPRPGTGHPAVGHQEPTAPLTHAQALAPADPETLPVTSPGPEEENPPADDAPRRPRPSRKLLDWLRRNREA